MTAFSVKQNLLDGSEFNLLLQGLSNLKHKEKQFSTEIEKQKEVYKLIDLDLSIIGPIQTIANDLGKDAIRQLTGWEGKLISLLELDGFGGYAPLHSMSTNGFLGSHVDHTYADDGRLIHVGNTIFYAIPKWEESWGGRTILFDRNGVKNTLEVIPQPNALFAFTHDCESFHGVSRITCPDSVYRTTIYMDYYILATDLKQFTILFNKTTKDEYFHSKYLTTFLPVVIENEKYIWCSIFSREFFGYFRNYVGYLRAKRIQKNKGGTNYPDLRYIILNSIGYIIDMGIYCRQKLTKVLAIFYR